MPTSRNVGFVYALCVRSGKGFFEGRYYALIKGAYNDGWSIVRSTSSGNIYELLVHNVGELVHDADDFETSAVFKTDDSFFCALPKDWQKQLEDYERGEC